MSSSPARRARRQAERAGGRQLDELIDEAIEVALAYAPDIVAAPTDPASERVIDVAFVTADDAAAARKRINEALAVREYLDEVSVWVWTESGNVRPPLSESGRHRGFELRMEKASEHR